MLLAAVVAWLVIRTKDRDETNRLFAQQQEEIKQLREELRGFRKTAPPAPQVAAAPPTPQPPPESAFQRPAPAAVMAAYLSQAAAPKPEPPPAQSLTSGSIAEPAPPPPIDPLPPPPVARPSLEQTLGTNWLNRLGITLLVFGVALYLAYQVTHFGPLGKVLTALAVSGVLPGGGLWLERRERYRTFARAGIGGGWALLFFTTYAMYHVPATQVLASEVFDLLLLFAVGIGMVAHSLRYRSQTVTGLAFLLAFSTVTISQVTAFSLLASAVLALGLEIVCVREAWYGLELAGVIAAYTNHFLWLDRTLAQYAGPGHSFPLWGESTALLLLFWAIFRAGYCLRRPPDEAGETLSGLVAILNSAGVLGLMTYQSFHPEWGFRALLALGAVELALAFVMRSRRRPAFAVLLVIASVLLAAAIPLRFGGATWPFLWVLQGEALFLGGLILKERLMRLLGTLVHLLVVLQLFFAHAGLVAAARPGGSGRIAAVFFCVAAAMWANAEWLSRNQEPADRTAHLETTAEFLGYATPVASFAAAVCAAMGLWILIPGWTLPLAWAALALVLLEAGLRTPSLSLRLQSYAVFVAALVRLVTINFTEPGRAGFADHRLWAGALLVAACVLLHERLSRATFPVPERVYVAPTAMWCASALVSSLLYLELPAPWLAAGWATFALALAAFALLRDGSRLRGKALLLAVMASVRALTVNLPWDVASFSSAVNWGPDWGRLAFFCAVGLLGAGVPLGFLLRRRPLPADGRSFGLESAFRRPEQVFFFSALALLVLWIPNDFHHGTLTMAWSLLGVAVFLVALGAGERSFRLAGLTLLLLGVAKLLLVDVWGLPSAERYLLLIGLGVALLLVSFLYSRFADRLKEYL